MKTKLILLLLAAGIQLALAASTNPAYINIHGTLSNYCTLGVGTSNVELGDLASISTSGSTSLTVTCRPDTPYSISVSSTNNWLLVSAANNNVAYTLSYTGALEGVLSTWSGQSEVASDQVGSGDPIFYPLSVVNSIASQAIAGGDFSDTISVVVTYT